MRSYWQMQLTWTNSLIQKRYDSGSGRNSTCPTNNLFLAMWDGFAHKKNHNYIIDVFKEICSVMPDSKLLLVGDGELLPL